MATINKVRLTNVVYEDGNKRFNDEVFHFNGANSAIVLENGGGKTVFIHTVLQAILPHTNLGNRRIKNTLQLENAPAHIGIEWITNENPLRYVATVVTLFTQNNELNSLKFVYEYEDGNENRLENMPFVKESFQKKRPATREEMVEYFGTMKGKSMNAATFDTHKSFHQYIEENYNIVTDEWKSIVKINSDEGGIEQFFEHCKTTTDLFDRLLIPTVEDSISGHEAHKFADIFEERREGFRMYRNFKQSLKEYEMIEQEIDQYVEQFAHYTKAKDMYAGTKQRAKGIALFLEEERKDIVAKKSAENEALQTCQDELHQLEIEKATFNILKAKERKEKLQANYYKKLNTYEAATEARNEQKMERANLQYAKRKRDLSVYKHQRDAYEQALKEKDDTGTVEQWQTSLEQLNAQIHGYYVEKIEGLKKAIDQLKFTEQPLLDTLKETNKSIDQQRQRQAKLQTNYDEIKGHIRSNEENIDQLKRRILANPAQEKVHRRYEEWIKEQAILDEGIVKAKNKIHEMKNEQWHLKVAIDESQAKLQNVKIARQKTLNEQQQLEKAHDETIEQLATVHATWQGINDLYLRESTIINRLSDMRQQRIKEREEILQRERIAHRFLDEYRHQSHFFTDPYLEEKIRDWQTDLYVQTGTQYIASLLTVEQKRAQTYKLWPLTIITHETDKARLEQRISAIKDKLQHPVLLLTIEQAKEIIKSHEMPDAWITPAHWDENLEEQAFEKWKAKMEVQAKEVTDKRTQADQTVEQINFIYEQTNKFFKQYPKEVKDSLWEKMTEQQTEEQSLGRHIAQLTDQLNRNEEMIINKENDIEEMQNKLTGIDKQIEIAKDIFQHEHRIQTLKEQQNEYRTQINRLNREIENLQQAKVRYEGDLSQLQEEKQDLERSILILKSHELYKEVQETRPEFTDEAIEVIREQREDFRLKIRGFEREYGEIRAKLDASLENIHRTKKEMQEIVEVHGAIDLTYTFPVDGDNRIARLNKRIREGEAQLKKLNELVVQAKSAYDKQDGTVQTKKDQFKQQFPNEVLAEFTIEYHEIPKYLTDREQTLEEQENYIKNRLDQIEKEEQNIEKATHKLDNFKEAHHFHKTYVSPIHLTGSERTDFIYNRYKVVTQITEQLTEQYRETEEAYKHLERAKRKFEFFCRNHITDRKLQQSAIEGMESKETYDEIITYQKNMNTILENAKKYARDFITENDKDVQAFINNIHNHLINVVSELRTIPNKTRVKVADGAKNIYHFSIPQWAEEEGKQHIREHLDWILTQLEKDNFKNEYGEEDVNKVRKQIEIWLETKSLLQIVMPNEKMRISCRKVTNDNQVSSRLTTWEQTNQWSGGEKWSKNMTLFLGLLNFVAEKKKQFNPNMARNRAVILDNPFGKASSGHVLDPVFFIAEQLGFQMIALTAHADGKFLQDYFPVMYSLRLRSTTDANKQVMETERKLHYAYFEDRDPGVFERLEKPEQLVLDLE